MDQAYYLKRWGCERNGWSVDDLFAFYDSMGLLFCQREAMIKKHLSQIKETWRLLMEANTDLFLEVSWHSKSRAKRSSMVIWKCTNNGYYSQCAASSTPIGTVRALHCLCEHTEESAFQDWFLPDNGFSNKIFGETTVSEMRETFSANIACNHYFNYLIVRPNILRDTSIIPELVKVDTTNQQEFLTLIEERFEEKKGENSISKDDSAGRIFIESEELHIGDINLDQLNSEYQKIGLQYTRHLYLAYLPQFSKPVGAIVSYRGPFGMNLRFMESRTFLFLNPALSPQMDVSVCSTLISKILPCYSGFPAGFIPVITGERERRALQSMGAELHIRYKRFSRTRDGAEGKCPFFKNKLRRNISQGA